MNHDEHGCEHKFVFQGVVWTFANYNLPGSGARPMVYEDAYFCERCLKMVYRNEREHGNSYSSPLAGSVPK